MTDEPTNFLYPFIDAQEDDPKSLLADLTASAQAKAAESLALRRSTLEANTELVGSCSRRAGASIQHRGKAFHLRQRWQLHRLHHLGAAVRPTACR